VVVVSHDRWFLDRCVDRVLSFEAGALRRFDGNYSAFLEWRLAHAGQEDRVERSRPGPSPRAGSQPAGDIAPATAAPQERQQRTDPSRQAPSPAVARKRTFGESRELRSIEEQLPQWEARRQEIERSLHAMDGGDYSQLEQLTLELAELAERIEAAEDRWLVLSELVA
jgi:ATP-binding cassette subfamily F protein uup